MHEAKTFQDLLPQQAVIGLHECCLQLSPYLRNIFAFLHFSYFKMKICLYACLKIELNPHFLIFIVEDKCILGLYQISFQSPLELFYVTEFTTHPAKRSRVMVKLKSTLLMPLKFYTCEISSLFLCNTHNILHHADFYGDNLSYNVFVTIWMEIGKLWSKHSRFKQAGSVGKFVVNKVKLDFPLSFYLSVLTEDHSGFS